MAMRRAAYASVQVEQLHSLSDVDSSAKLARLIDIAEIKVGENVGAKLQEAQAEANKSIAQAQAEIRRAAAVAVEQEMKARVQEMQAKVVEAQAQVPLAMAEAFRSGRLGIMDPELDAFFEHFFDQGQSRSLAHVVGARLECQAPDTQTFTFQVFPVMSADLGGQYMLLPIVDFID